VRGLASICGGLADEDFVDSSKYSQRFLAAVEVGVLGVDATEGAEELLELVEVVRFGVEGWREGGLVGVGTSALLEDGGENDTGRGHCVRC
jgi:hypothetical protein